MNFDSLLLLDDGWSAERVAAAIFIDADTVREHRRLYQAAGASGVGRLKYEGGEPALTPEHRAARGAELDKTLYMTATAVCVFVQRTFAVGYSAHAMAKRRRRLDSVCKKPKRVPAKANEETQRAFFEATSGPPMASAGDETPLCFVDGTHPSYIAHAAFKASVEGFFGRLDSYRAEITAEGPNAAQPIARTRSDKGLPSGAE